MNDIFGVFKVRCSCGLRRASSHRFSAGCRRVVSAVAPCFWGLVASSRLSLPSGTETTRICIHCINSLTSRDVNRRHTRLEVFRVGLEGWVRDNSVALKSNVLINID